MSKRFDVVYDDFTGGHFVGPSQANQPHNTWTGANVLCTADEGFLMPDGGWSRSAAVKSAVALSEPTPPIRAGSIFGDFGIIFAIDKEVFTVLAGVSTVRGAFANDVNGHASIGASGDAVSFGAVAVNQALTILIDGTWTTSTSATTGATFYGFWRWKEWLLHFDYNILYFSNPDSVVFPAGNFLTFYGSNIGALVSTNDQLLVLTSDGWFSVTGVLGETTNIRKMANIGSQYFSNILAGAEADSGVLFPAGEGEALRLLSGTQVYAAMHASGTVIDRIVNASDCVVATSDNHFWIWSNTHRRWRRSDAPTATEQGHLSIAYWPAEDGTVSSSVLSAVGHHNTTGSTYTVYGWDTPREPLQPVSTGGAFNSATVTLAEYQHNAPFKVNEILAEVDFGQPVVQTGERSLAVAAITNAITDLDQTFVHDTDGTVLPAQSSTITKVWGNATATKVGDRQMTRFGVSDGAASTYTAAPKLTLKGVKVRRVIMRCEEVG